MHTGTTKIIGVVKNFLVRFLPDSWVTVRGEEANSIYLTFDDGPDPNVTPQLLDLLKNRNAKATFFLVGTNVEAYPELVSRIVENGHSVGNHSYNHKQFHELELKTQLQEIIKTNTLIEKITGAKCKLFRAPGGRLSLRLFLKLIRLGITSVHWSKDSMDWKENGEQTISYLEKSPVKRKDIVLLHDDHQKVLRITEYILNKHESCKFEKIPSAGF
jgi:peptidoglycan/xylan/chitin deacetylase (PgdA/CDA1 family)